MAAPVRLRSVVSFGCAASLFAAVLTGSATASAEPAPAPAPPTREACITSHAESQELRLEGKLLETRAELLVCSNPACPSVLQSDCAGWLASVQQSIPSLMILAENEAGDVVDVKVTVDGKLLTERLDGGTAYEFNPGAHRFVFELAGYPPVEQTVVLRQDEKRRALRVVFAKERPVEPAQPGPGAAAPGPAAPPPAASEPLHGPRPVPMATWVFGALALAGAGTSAYFGVTGLNEYNDKKDSCSPNCPKEDVDDVNMKLLIADIAGGAAIISAGFAAFFYATRPVVREGSQAEGLPRWSMTLAPDKVGVGYRGSF